VNRPEKTVALTIKILDPKPALRRVLQIGQQPLRLHFEQAAPARLLRHPGHMDCGHHRPRHAPHQLSDRQFIICLCARMHQINQVRCGRKAHRQHCRTHVATEQRAVLGVIGWRIALEGGDRPLQQLGEHGAKVCGNAGRTDTMQIIQRPDDTGRSIVKTGIAVCHAIVARVSRPERVGIEMGDRIGGDFFDRSPDSQFTPGVMCERTMTTKRNHA
jgi:hypothetical protein